MSSAGIRRPRRSVVALIVILLGVFAAAPSAWAATQKGHGDRTQHFTVLSTDPSETESVIVAKGPIHARGTDKAVNDKVDTFAFPDGKVTIRHKATHQGKDTFDHVTCYFTYTEHGTYKVTGGTGAYDDARGHGDYTVSVAGVGCDENKKPDVFTLRIDASGPLHF